jgi:hypothetical protein
MFKPWYVAMNCSSLQCLWISITFKNIYVIVVFLGIFQHSKPWQRNPIANTKDCWWQLPCYGEQSCDFLCSFFILFCQFSCRKHLKIREMIYVQPFCDNFCTTFSLILTWHSYYLSYFFSLHCFWPIRREKNINWMYKYHYSKDKHVLLPRWLIIFVLFYEWYRLIRKSLL